MRILFTLTFILLSTCIFCQEYLQHEIPYTYSLEIFEIKDVIHHVHNRPDQKAYITKTNLKNFDSVDDEISNASFESQLFFYSKDSVDVYLNDLFFMNKFAIGFGAYQNHKGVQTLISEIILDSDNNSYDVCPLTPNKFVLNSYFNSDIYIYNKENGSLTQASVSQPNSKAKMFRKSEFEYYLTSLQNTFLATIDPADEKNIEFKKISDHGHSNARWISNSQSFGFLENDTYYIVDIPTGNVTKWMEGIMAFTDDYYFTGDALYTTNVSEEIMKYTLDSEPTLVFSPSNLNSSIDVNISSIFVKSDSLVIGGETVNSASPWCIKIKEGETFNGARPNLEIDEAVCDIKDSTSNIKVYDCSYKVTNKGNVPVNKFSVYSTPELDFGNFGYSLNQTNSEPLKPNESIVIKFNSYNINWVPLEFYIEGANNLLLGEIATTEVKHLVSNENIQKKPSISIFPNPSNDYFYIKGAASNSQYSLINSKGQILKKGELIDDRIEIADLENGSYFIQLWHNNQMTILEGVKM